MSIDDNLLVAVGAVQLPEQVVLLVVDEAGVAVEGILDLRLGPLEGVTQGQDAAFHHLLGGARYGHYQV